MTAQGVAGSSLSGVAFSANKTGYTGSAVDAGSALAYSHSSMIVSMSGYAGTGVVAVALEVSHDGSVFQQVAQVNFGEGPEYVNAEGLPARAVRARIVNWPATVTAGTVTATVAMA